MANRTRYENIIIPKMNEKASIDEIRQVLQMIIKAYENLLIELKKQEEE